MMILFPLCSFSQVTIAESDLALQYALGNTITTYTNLVVIPVDIGSPGGENNWDFQWFTLSNPVAYTVRDPSETQFWNDFPQSTHCLFYSFTEEGNIYKIYSYLNLTPDDFNSNGDASTFSGVQGSITKTINTPQQILMELPLNYGSTWQQNYISHYTSEVNGVVQFEETLSITTNSIVDAWGTIKLPGGLTVDALRQREDRITISQTTGSYERIIVYTFITKNNGQFVVPVDTTQPDHGEVIVNGVVSWNGNFATEVREVENTPADYLLKQNYPNPFNPSTKIEYSLPSESFVSLKVYDILGNKVTTLVNEQQHAGVYRVDFIADNLPSGMYFARITANEFTQVVKMTLLK